MPKHVAAVCNAAGAVRGIHFRFADTNALRQGTHVANWAYSHELRPIRGNRRSSRD